MSEQLLRAPGWRSSDEHLLPEQGLNDFYFFKYVSCLKLSLEPGMAVYAELLGGGREAGELQALAARSPSLKKKKS